MCNGALRWVEPITPKPCDAPATHSEMRGSGVPATVHARWKVYNLGL
eukprot:COSAG01_NODE_2324_length_7907_cov_69.755763_1_plen_46_part_10